MFEIIHSTETSLKIFNDFHISQRNPIKVLKLGNKNEPTCTEVHIFYSESFHYKTIKTPPPHHPFENKKKRIIFLEIFSPRIKLFHF